MSKTRVEFQSRAVLLGGGGVAGISWELGVVVGLLDEGVKLTNADALIGTSAGAFVAIEIASGVDLEVRYAKQLSAETREIPAVMSTETQLEYRNAIREGLPDRRRIGVLLGGIAKAAKTVSTEERAVVVASRLPITEWPEAQLKITAIDADSGELHVLDRNSGLTLTEAAMASGAVPAVWPMVTAGGRQWIDGGVVSVANVELGAAYERVVVIAPATGSFPGLRSVQEQVADLREGGVQVELISPDERTLAVIGQGFLDPAKRGPAAEAGRAQGRVAADAVRRLWNYTDGEK